MVIFLGEVEEGVGDSGIVGDEPTVEVGKAKEGSDVFDPGWGWLGSDAIELDRVHGELTGFHNHSKVFDFWDVELAFFKFEIEVKLGHTLEDMASLFGMGLGVGGGNEKVVHVDDKPSFSNHVSKRVIHELLECSRGVAKAKEHDGGFKESFVSNEGRLPLVTIFDADVVVPPVNIELSEVASVFQLVHEVRDEREGVGVTGGIFVEVLVVLAGVKFAIFLFDKEERGCLGGVERTNFPCS